MKVTTAKAATRPNPLAAMAMRTRGRAGGGANDCAVGRMDRVPVDTCGGATPSGGMVAVRLRSAGSSRLRRSALHRSPTVAKRSASGATSARAKTASTGSDTSSPRARGVTPGRVAAPLAVARRSQSTTARAWTSACAETRAPGAALRRSFATPKSSSITRRSPRSSSSPKRMWSGVTSAWAMPCSCAMASATATGSMSGTSSGSVRGRCEACAPSLMYWRSVTPCGHSRTT
jgi:hypothetical protein